MNVLMNTQSTHKWWSILKSAEFGLSSSLPLLINGGDGGLVGESIGKADQLSDYFHGMQSRECADLLLTCHPSPRFTTFACWSSEIRRILLDLDTYGGLQPTRPIGYVSSFSQENC